MHDVNSSPLSNPEMLHKHSHLITTPLPTLRAVGRRFLNSVIFEKKNFSVAAMIFYVV